MIAPSFGFSWPKIVKDNGLFFSLSCKMDLHHATHTFNIWFLMPRENEWIQCHQSLQGHEDQVEIINLEELSTKLIINEKVAVI